MTHFPPHRKQGRVLSKHVEYCNDGPWKCWPVGDCGDIVDTRCNKFYGSMLYLDALEIVRQLNQRWRWLKEQPRTDGPTGKD